MSEQLSIRDYVLAGNSLFTLESLRTGKHFTFRVRQAREGLNCGSLHFVSVLVNPDNTKDYQYLGTIFDDVRYHHGVKSRIGYDAPDAVAFRWLWSHLDDLDRFPVRFHRSTYCCRCGRTLTVPESIRLGIGPECAQKLGIDADHRGGKHEPPPSK